MKISGFTMVRNATKLYYPVKAAIESILPVCDEFVVALGNCDPDDGTEKEIVSIQSDKIKIIRTVWDREKYPDGMVYAQQTDIAMRACTGDWLFYIQSDEVVHEKYLPVIKEKCSEHLSNEKVEGILFEYKHFWGDYRHYIVSHAWYPREIRIVRNKPDIHSWRDAQSFRRIPNFNGLNYQQKEGTYKLNVVPIEAYIYHYGWVRPPKYMQTKRKTFTAINLGEEKASRQFQELPEAFNYGDLSKLRVYTDTDPKVMKEWISKFDWADQLEVSAKTNHKHERFRYRLLTSIEQNLMGGQALFGFKNYKLIN